jgi:hypothetical protein
MLLKQIKGVNKLFFNLVIGFGCICVRNDFLTKQSIAMHTASWLWSFQVLERINCNAYKTDFLDEYGVSATFNIDDFTFFNIGFDSRSNPFEERRDDVDQQGPSFEGFNQVRFEESIRVSRGGPSTSYSCARWA